MAQPPTYQTPWYYCPPYSTNNQPIYDPWLAGMINDVNKNVGDNGHRVSQDVAGAARALASDIGNVRQDICGVDESN